MDRISIPFENLMRYPQDMAQDIAEAMSQPGDAIAKVVDDFRDVSACTLSIPESRALILRAGNRALYWRHQAERLADLCDRGKWRVLRRLKDGLLGQIINGYNALSCHLSGAAHDA